MVPTAHRGYVPPTIDEYREAIAREKAARNRHSGRFRAVAALASGPKVVAEYPAVGPDAVALDDVVMDLVGRFESPEAGGPTTGQSPYLVASADLAVFRGVRAVAALRRRPATGRFDVALFSDGRD